MKVFLTVLFLLSSFSKPIIAFAETFQLTVKLNGDERLRLPLISDKKINDGESFFIYENRLVPPVLTMDKDGTIKQSFAVISRGNQYIPVVKVAIDGRVYYADARYLYFHDNENVFKKNEQTFLKLVNNSRDPVNAYKVFPEASSPYLAKSDDLKIDILPSNSSLFSNSNDYIKYIKDMSQHLEKIKPKNEYHKQQIENAKNNIKRELEKNYQSEKAKCPSYDYRKRLPPTRDQDSMGWCFGFVAADVISFETGKEISAIDTTLNSTSDIAKNIMKDLGFKEERTSNSQSSYIKGGVTEVALLAAKKVCLEKDLRSPDYRISEKYLDLKSTLLQIEQYAGQNKPNYGRSGKKILPSKEPSSYNDELVDAIQSLAPNLSYQKSLELVHKYGPQEIIAFLRKNTCKNKINNPINKATWVPNSSDSMISDVQKQLKNGKIVPITYNPNVLYTGEDQTCSEIKCTSGHASSIIGQRWNEETNQCDFLLRNSWGSNCSYSQLECDLKDGSIWISSELLSSYTAGILTYERKK